MYIHKKKTPHGTSVVDYKQMYIYVFPLTKQLVGTCKWRGMNSFCGKFKAG